MKCPKCGSEDIKMGSVVHEDVNELGEAIEGTEDKEMVDYICTNCEHGSYYWSEFSTVGNGGGNNGE